MLSLGSADARLGRGGSALNPFAIQSLKGPLPGLSALSKAFFLACISIAAMNLSLPLLAVLLTLFLASGQAMGLKLKDAAGAGLSLGILMLFTSLARGIFPADGRLFAPESLAPSALYALRLALIFACARIFYASTRVSQLGDFLTVLVRPVLAGKGSVTPGKNPHTEKTGKSQALAADPGMMLSLALVFVPRAFENFKKLREAALARGYGRGKTRFGSSLALLYTFIFSSIKSSLRTAEAMEARAYSPRRTIVLPGFSLADFALAGIGLLVVILSLLWF